MLPHQLSEFYVYVHRRSDTRRIFYVGKGTGGRGLNFNSRLPDWHAARSGCDVVVDVVDHSMSDKDARCLEAALIDFIVSTGGALANRALTKQAAPKPAKPQKPPREMRVRHRKTRSERRKHPPASINDPIVCLSTRRTFRDAHAVVRWAKQHGIGAIAPITIARMAANEGVFASLRWRSVKIT